MRHGLSSCSLLRGSWERLNAVKVITQMTQNWMFFFSGTSLWSTPVFGLWDSVRLHFPSSRKTSVELHLQLQIWLFSNIWKNVFFSPLFIKNLLAITFGIFALPKAFTLLPSPFQNVSPSSVGQISSNWACDRDVKEARLTKDAGLRWK